MAAAATDVIRIKHALKQQAELEGKVLNRRAAEQIEHWATLGRTLERMEGVSLNRVRDCLEAKHNVDELNLEEKALVYATLHKYETHAVFPDFAAIKQQSGLAYTELNADGEVVRIQPDGSQSVVKAP